MSPPSKKESWVFQEFSNRINRFFMFKYLKSVYWLSSVRCTWVLLIDCLLCVLHEECSWIIWWCCAMKLKNVNKSFLFCFLKYFYWLSSVSCTQRVLTDYLICVALEVCSLIYWWYCALKLKRMFTDFVYYGTWKLFTDCPYCTLPEEGKLIKYSHQMSLHPKRNFWGFPSFPMFVSIPPLVLHAKIIYFTSSGKIPKI